MFRTFYMYGTSTVGTSAIVTVDGVIEHAGPVNGPELFTFVTSVTKHGYVDVNINVIGSITFNEVWVIYPAIINDSVKGFLHFTQPIVEPFAINKQIVKFPFTITDETISYQHLMFNGPYQFDITTDIELYNGITIKCPNDNTTVNGPKWGYDNVRVLKEHLNDVIELEKLMYP